MYRDKLNILKDIWSLKKKNKLINRFTFLFRAIQWISIVSDKKSKTSNPVLKAMCDLVYASLSILFLGHTSCLTHHASTTLAFSKFFKWAWSLLSQRLCKCYSLCLNILFFCLRPYLPWPWPPWGFPAASLTFIIFDYSFFFNFCYFELFVFII